MAEPSRDTKSASMGAKVPDAEKPVPDRQFRWLRGKTAVVTGGAGFVGRNIGLDLLSLTGCGSVRLVDWRDPVSWNGRENEAEAARKSGKLQIVKMDITSETDVIRALAGAHAVFHVASYGMSGPEMLARDRIWNINLGGTKNVVKACLANAVPVLVYTSSYNVIFGGQIIEGQDESSPYFPLSGHTEEYSKSKTVAERFVLEQANGTEFTADNGSRPRSQVGTKLRCAAVRAAAIYGEGEERHFPRILRMLKQGLITFTYGSPKYRVDWVHIRNLSQAEMLAAERMGQELEFDVSGEDPESYPYRRVAGRKYFASDGDPENQFELLRPFFELYGYPFPPSFLCLPLWLMLILGHICEIYFNITAGKLGGPFLTRAEVLKSGQCHWFKITATERDLGYKSYMDSKTGFANMAKWFAERDPDLKRKRSFAERWSGMILIGGFIVSILALSLIFVSLGGR